MLGRSLWTDVLPDSTEIELADMANSPAVGKVEQGARSHGNENALNARLGNRR